MIVNDVCEDIITILKDIGGFEKVNCDSPISMELEQGEAELLLLHLEDLYGFPIPNEYLDGTFEDLAIKIVDIYDNLYI